MATLQIDFTEAMSDFKKMFPDMDRDVIEAVLRVNQGAVDATIDQLLAMSTDNQNEKLRNELESPVHNKNTTTTNIGSTMINNTNTTILSSPMPLQTPERRTPSLNTPPPNVLPSGVLNTGASPKIKKSLNSTTNSPVPSPLKGVENVKGNSKKWDPPLLGPLPQSFLRITFPDQPVAASGELPDEQFAMMLQNEEFMNELRWNQVNISQKTIQHRIFFL